jgi:hypothetical protein
MTSPAMSLGQSPGCAALDVAGVGKLLVAHPDPCVVAGDVHGDGLPNVRRAGEAEM